MTSIPESIKARVFFRSDAKEPACYGTTSIQASRTTRSEIALGIEAEVAEAIANFLRRLSWVRAGARTVSLTITVLAGDMAQVFAGYAGVGRIEIGSWGGLLPSPLLV